MNWIKIKLIRLAETRLYVPMIPQVVGEHIGLAFYTLGHLYDRKHMGQDAAIMYRRARELSRG